MGKKRNKKKGSKQGLSGTSAVATANPYLTSAKDGGLVMASALLASGLGAAFGKHSFFMGIPIVLLGAYKKNLYIIAAGTGMMLSNGFQKPASAAPTTQGIDGFDFKKIAADAKDRVGTFFENFKEKLYLPKSQPQATETTTEGLGEDQVTYFVNPYSNKELDMSAIDRIQEQIAKMNESGASGLEVDREF